MGMDDNENVKNDPKERQWKADKNLQEYHGEFLQNSLHGCGKYNWNLEKTEIIYDGQFFANDLEGYARVKYSSGEIFEGLFKNNRRFGPGIFTYPYGFQDVGFWDGRYLMRLCCVANTDLIPQVAKSPKAKSKVLKFRNLIPVCTVTPDKATEILKKLHGSYDIIKKASKLHSSIVRQRGSLFFNYKLFEKSYFRETKNCSDQTPGSTESKRRGVCFENNYFEEPDGEWEEAVIPDCPKMCILYSQEIRLRELNDQIVTLNKIIKFLRLKERRAYRDFQKRTSVEWPTKHSYDDEEGKGWINEDEVGEEDGLHFSGSLEKFVELVPFLRSSINSFNEFVKKITTQLNRSSLCKTESAIQNKILAVDPRELYLKRINELLGIVIQNKKFLLDEKNNLLKGIVALNEKEIEVHEPLSEDGDIKELIAWNNEEYVIEMMAHSFLHRKMEDKLSIDISHLFSGDRSQYKQRGPYEGECIHFLECCASANVDEIYKLGCKCISPDVSDCKGNTGMFAAVAKNNIIIIRALVNLGAGIDVFNDECFTPLTFCICKYICIINDATNWEQAFIGPSTVFEEPEDKLQWHFPQSLGSLPMLDSNMKSPPPSPITKVDDTENLCQENVQTVDQKPQYLLGIECVRPVIKKMKRGDKPKKDKQQKGKKRKKNVSESTKSSGDRKKKRKGEVANKAESKKSKLKREKEEALQEQREMEARERNLKLDGISTTITVLLELGSDPNVGEFPLPPLILSVFTKSASLVGNLLQKSADPNLTSAEEGMTALHFLASTSIFEEGVEIIKKLLEYGANPDLRTGPLHWMNEVKPILPNESSFPYDGKTALHILCMRYDYIHDEERIMNRMVQSLADSNANTELLYLGHSALSLAILRGNAILIEDMLKTHKFDPNQILGGNMGVPLTVLLLKRYIDVQPQVVCEKVITVLIEYNANPFRFVSDIGNNVEFINKEYEPPPKVKGKDRKMLKNKSQKVLGKGKKGKEGNTALIKYFKNAARNVLTRYIQAKCVKNLFIFISENYFNEPFLTHMAKFVTPKEGFDILQTLVENKRIKINNASQEIFAAILYFIQDKNKNIEEPKKHGKPSQPQETIGDMIKGMNLSTKQYPYNPFSAYPPELDKSKEKYVVCFNCLCSVDKELVVCPQCCVVYFCSEACNRQSIRGRTRHRCKMLFYKSEKKRIQELKFMGLSHESPLESKLIYIKEMIKQRKIINELENQIAKEWDMIYGKGGKISESKMELRNKFMREKMMSRTSQLKFGASFKCKSEILTPAKDKKTTAKTVTRKGLDVLNLTDYYYHPQAHRKPPSKIKKQHSPLDTIEDKRRLARSSIASELEFHEKKNMLSQEIDGFRKPSVAENDLLMDTESQLYKNKAESVPQKRSTVHSRIKSSKKILESLTKKSEENSSVGTPREKLLTPRKTPGSSDFRKNHVPSLPSAGLKSLKPQISNHKRKKSSLLTPQSPRLFNRQVFSPRGISVRTVTKIGKSMGFKPGQICKKVYDYQGLIYPAKLPEKFQVLLEKLTEHMSDFDISKLFLQQTCFTGDQFYYRFKESALPFCGTYSDV